MSAADARRPSHVMFIWADGMPTPDELAGLQRDLPSWVQDVDRRGVRLFGRELDLPETAATVRVRRGRSLVTDGPFAETKEFLAGFDLLACADAAEALDVAVTNPIARVQALELRSLARTSSLDERARAFGRSQDGAGRPYLLAAWTGAEPAAADEVDAWRHDLHVQGVHVLGIELAGSDAARTVRVRDGETLLEDRPGTGLAECLTDIEVVSVDGRAEALELAAGHPLARDHAIEVRPFYVE